MARQLLRGGLVFDAERGFVPRDVVLEGEKIGDLGSAPASSAGFDRVHDVAGCRIVPGFVDLHFHGARGLDVMEASTAGLDAICAYQARSGTTSFLATTITSRMAELLVAVERIAAHPPRRAAARVVGLHIEGPYINPKQKGCHRIEWMKEPDVADYQALRTRAAGKRLHFTIAPELRDAIRFIRAAAEDGATVSLGHSDSSAEQARCGLDAGARVFTHLFNAMTGLHHREPGMVGAALSSAAFVELICDGVHVRPEVVNLVYRCKGRDRIVLVTDAMHAAGLGDGDYTFGGCKVSVRGGVARNEEGRLASSTITMLAAVKNMVRFTGAPLEEVIPMATRNPAQVIGMEHEIGTIAPGRQADLVVLDDRLGLRAVFCAGEEIQSL